MDIKQKQRIIIKIGSALLVNEAGTVHDVWLAGLAEDIAALKQHAEVIIVSSGSIALGRDKLGIHDRPLKLEEKQAAAACGQLDLIQAYQQHLGKHNIAAAQILLTIEDTENRRRYLNSKHTIETLLEAGVIPVINENDTVTTEEIRYGDNDRLAARVAQMVGADLLILLSDVDGLYTANPTVDKKVEHVAVVEAIDETIEAMADGVVSQVGSGGMITKIAAAKIATSSGCDTVITLGKQEHPVRALQEGGKHTVFTAQDNPISARKNWIAHHLTAMGEIVVDAGAEKALKKGSSLLPAGVTMIQGEFERGDAIVIKNQQAEIIGRGLSSYASRHATLILGKKTSEFESSPHYNGRDELIHRDDMVLE